MGEEVDGSHGVVETEDHQEEGVGGTGECTLFIFLQLNEILSSAFVVLSAKIAINVCRLSVAPSGGGSCDAH